jgi:two-component system CheB/CheR fusion protein
VSATIGTTSLCAGGLQPWSRFPALWSVWWIGDAIGALVMAPPLLVWLAPEDRTVARDRRLEAAAFGLVLLLVDVTVFSGRIGLPPSGYPLQFAVFPLVVWAAMRLGRRGAATTTLVTSAIAIWSTAQGLGPFAIASTHENLLLLQTFMAVVSVTGLLLAAAVAERDAAERRAVAEYEELRRGEERLRLALDAGHMAVWDWNVPTGAVTWEGYSEVMSALPAGAFDGTRDAFLALVHPDDRPTVAAAIVESVERHADYAVQFRMAAADGDVRWVASRGRVLADANGDAARMLGVALDVTERQQLTDQLRAKAEALADADRRKDEFLAMLAHELRNPLAPLSNALHLLAIDHPDRGRLVAMASRQVTLLVRLVDDLLDVSRITRGMITLRREPTALADVIARAVEMVRPDVDARSQAFTVSVPSTPIRLLADPARLAQVVANLLGNASKYTPPGGAIWLTAERLEAHVVLRVRDTGAGIAPDLLPHVFDLFVQGDVSLARTAGGLGIGLTIVHRLVAMHGGRVEARSDGPGRGSELAVTLPVMADDLAPVDDTPSSGTHPPGGLRVLIVEDNVDMAESLAMLLSQWGHQVQLAYDAASALVIAARERPEVILSDLGLPGMDGYELARRLRAEPAFGKVVLVALTGYGRPEDQRRALDAGFDHHLVKPPDLAGLAELLGRVATSASAGARPRVLH